MCYFFFTTSVVKMWGINDVKNVKAEKRYTVYIILSKLDTDIPENILEFHGHI